MNDYPHDDHYLPAEHERFLTVLSELRKRFPNWRLGQMIDNLARMAESDAYGVEDSVLLSIAESFLQRHKDRDPYANLPAAAGAVG